MENKNIKLLDDAYKNVRMGSYAIDCIITKIKDAKLKKLIEKQNEIYLEFTNELSAFAQKISYELKDINVMLKTSSFLSINLKTLFNKDTSHIAEMLVQGTTMGITTLIREIRENPNATLQLIDLSNEIVSYQEKFVESLKKFL